MGHLAEVAGYTATAEDRYQRAESIAVAWLHDTMEDCEVTHDLLTLMFGPTIANGVKMLSDLDEGNRQKRNELSRARLSQAEPWIQTIKYADLISNTASIVKYDPKFAAVYLAEKRELLAVMRDGDPFLYRRALELANQPIPESK